MIGRSNRRTLSFLWPWNKLENGDMAPHIHSIGIRWRWGVCEIDSGNNWTGGWVGPRSGLHTAEKEIYLPWFQTVALLWMSYSFFWVIPRRLNFMCRRFGTLHKSCEHHLWRWNRLSVPKRRHITFRSRGITQKKDYNEVSLTPPQSNQIPRLLSLVDTVSRLLHCAEE